MTLPRSVYAEKLREFPDIAFGDGAAFQFRGGWGDFFRQRLGPAFDGRVIFEIGCSDAAYISRIAAKFPVTGFVGLDWKCKALYDGAQRVTDLGLNNIALLRGRGQEVLKIFADGEIDEIWVFHPDPCDREIELKNRLIGEPFLGDVHRVLRSRASVLALKTDHPGYHQWVLGLFDVAEIRGRFEMAMNSANYWHDPAALAHTSGRCFSGERTFYESRFIKKRLPIYYLEMRKK